MIYLKRPALVSASKKKERDNVPAGLKAHRYTGYILAIFVVGHIAATRLLPLMLENPSDYDYGFTAYANEIMPGNIFMMYLLVFGGAGVWHLAYGTRSALATLSGESVIGKPIPLPLVIVALVSMSAVFLGIFALNGYIYDAKPAMKAKAELHEYLFSFESMLVGSSD